MNFRRAPESLSVLLGSSLALSCQRKPHSLQLPVFTAKVPGKVEGQKAIPDTPKHSKHEATCLCIYIDMLLYSLEYSRNPTLPDKREWEKTLLPLSMCDKIMVILGPLWFL